MLFGLLPALHRAQDAESAGGNGALHKFMSGLRPSFDNLRGKIQRFTDLRDPLSARSQYNDIVRLRLGTQVVDTGTVEQANIDGQVTATGSFFSQHGLFDDRHLGGELTIRGSQTATNNRVVRVSQIVSRQEVVVAPALTFSPSDRGLRWELRSAVASSKESVTVEVVSGDVSSIAPGHVLTDGHGLFEVLERRQFNDPSAQRKFLTEQEGQDGRIDSLGFFVSSTIQVTQADVGRSLTIPNPEKLPSLIRTEITSITPQVGSTKIGLDKTFDENEEPFGWALLPRAELDLEAITSPLGVTEQFGFDGTLDPDYIGATDIFRASSANFLAGDVGKMIYLRGSASSPSNDGPVRILAVLTPKRVQVDKTFTFPDSVGHPLPGPTTGSLFWELRSRTAIGDLTQVEVAPQSLLALLASDFGIELDRQETDARQRSWVRNTHQWRAIKGTTRSYEVVALISGFNATPQQLWRITQGLAGLIPTDNLIEVGESGTGRTGIDGILVDGSGRIRFSAPTAVFSSLDIGKQIRIESSGSGNDGLRTIDRIVDATTVEFRLEDSATVPDANNGALLWSVVRLYSTLPPLLPNFDDIHAELMAAIVAQEYVSYTALTTNFVIGDTVTGGTSGATAILVSDTYDGGPIAGLVEGTFRLADVFGTFQDGEVITGALSGSATIDTVGAGKFFGIDHYCWEENFVKEVPVKVLAVEPFLSDPGIYEVTVEGPAHVIGVIGNWRFVDHTGTEFFVDSQPQAQIGYTTLVSGFTAGHTLYAPLKLDYSTLVGAFGVGNIVTGSTSGAVGKIVEDINAGVTGTLRITNVVGLFIDGEPLTSPGATANAASEQIVVGKATISAVVTASPTTGTLFLTDIFGVIRAPDPLFAFLDSNGDFVPDTTTGKATQATNLQFKFQTNANIAPQTSAPEFQYDLPYIDQTSVFTVGHTLTGAPSGATANILDNLDNPDDTGVLTIDGLVPGPNPFQPGDAITDVPGAAVAASRPMPSYRGLAGTPAFWDAVLRYVCPLNFTCDFCASHVVFVNITEGDIVNDGGIAVEDAFERVLHRLKTEIVPAHVELAVRFTRPVEIPVEVGVTIGDWIITP